MSKLDDTLASLGTKLDGLDLTENERNTLLAVLDAACVSVGDDVEGFGIGAVSSFGAYLPRFTNVFSLSPLTDDGQHDIVFGSRSAGLSQWNWRAFNPQPEPPAHQF